MIAMRSIIILITSLLLAAGCAEREKSYGTERQLFLPGKSVRVWAVAPAVNLSGVSDVDPLIQADLAYAQLQSVTGLKIIPVNRVVEVFAGLGLREISNDEQAALVCDALAADGVIVPTVTAYDPYNPPRFGAALQLFSRTGIYPRPGGIDPRELARRASPGDTESLPASANVLQVVGIYDAANGSVREKLQEFADGRNDPAGPLGSKAYLVSMDRYCEFVYHDLIDQLLLKLQRTVR